MKKRTILFILNPVSGLKKNKKSVKDIINAAFAHQSSIDYQVVFTQRPGHATQLAKEAAQQNVDVVVAVGGDGTMNEVASGLVHSNSALGLIPRGSGNGYARSMGIPMNTLKALQVLKTGQTRKVDVGKVNDFYFFGVSGVGFDAFIGAQFQSSQMRGPLPYFYIGVREFFKYDYEGFTLQFDDQKIEVNPLLVAVANTPQYGMGAKIAPEAKPDDGFLDLCILNRMSVLEALTHLHALFDGKINTVPFYQHFKVKELKLIRQAAEGIVHTDGEPRMGPKELAFKILPAALKVIVPANGKMS